MIEDRDVYALLEHIIDSYETEPGKGLPLGNQSSQWFALYYLDGLDRMVKEQLRVRAYVRYMDDFILIHPDKEFLRKCLLQMKEYLERELKLEFNEKTQILPMKNGIGFLGFHFYLSETGKVIRKVRRRTKTKYRRRLREMIYLYREWQMDASDVHQVLSSYKAHLDHGHTGHLQEKHMKAFILQRSAAMLSCGRNLVISH